MNTDMKRLILAGLLAASATCLLGETIVITSTSNQTQSVTVTVPYCADIEVHGNAYGPPYSYITGNTPIGGFYYTPSNGSLHMTGTVQAGTYTIYQNVGYSGYLCVMIMMHPGPYSLSSTTAVTSPSNRQRTKIGVGEAVTVTLSPTPSSTSWAITNGGGSLSGASSGQVTYTAPATASDVTVTAASGGYNYTRTFQVVAPSGVYMERDTGLGVYHESGKPSAGMLTNTYILPNDVNFSAIEVREETCTSTATGYFFPLNGVTHPQGAWIPLSPHTSGKGTGPSDPLMRDVIAISGQFWWTQEAGTFSWPIPWSYKMKGGGSVYSIATITQAATAYASGTVTISKASAIYTADLNDPNGSWYP